MIDRKVPPQFNKLETVALPTVKHITLDNGRQVFFLNDNHADVFKIDLLLKSGSWYTDNYNLVPITLRMLIEGSQTKTGKELVDAFDGLGSFTEFVPGFDRCSVGLYGLAKYFDKNLALLAELLFTPAFDEASFTSLKKREAQKLRLNLEKSSYRSSVNLRANLFGTQHPYGIRTSPEVIAQTPLSDSLAYYQSNFSDFDMLISGKLPEGFEAILNQHFGQHVIKAVSTEGKTPTNGEHQPEPEVIERDAKFIQSSIRLGKQLFNRSHKDYVPFMLLNEVLGGYFGSRLMKNIREEKGFTYGIYSQLYSLNNAGYFSIGTDVNSENETQTIEEIHKEIQLLQTELIPENELTTVKNYMTGTFAGSISSAFSIMDKFKAAHYQGLELSFFEQYIQTINSLEASQLQVLAQQYLAIDSLSLAVVGK